jgi:hypothetical protein
VSIGVTLEPLGVPLAEVELELSVGEQDSDAAAPTVAEARPYRKVFACYSHQDASIVSQLELFSHALGDRFLRDVIDLRAGSLWDED